MCAFVMRLKRLEAMGRRRIVMRAVTFHLHGILGAAQPLVVSTIRRESGRLLEMIKRYVERGVI